MSRSFFFLIISALILLFIHTKGFIPSDEGLILQGGNRIAQGEIVNLDFQFYYNSGSLYLTALFFKIFGTSLLSARLLAFSNSLISVFLLLILGRQIKLTKLHQLLLISLYIFWGPGHLNTVWPVMFCLTTAITTMVMFAKEPAKKYIFYSGIIAAITFIFKQNFGLGILLADLIYLIIIQKKQIISFLRSFFAGYFLIVFFGFVYLLLTKSLVPYITDFYNLTFINIFQHGILSTPLPWQYSQPLFIKIIKTLIYLFPLFISLALIFKRQPKKIIFIPLVSFFYYCFSIRPTTDYTHLTPLLTLTAISLVVIARKNIFLKVALIIFLVVGIYSSIFKDYYRWFTPLLKQTVFISMPKVQIWSDGKNKETVSQITTYFDVHAKEEKYFFVYDFSPMWYLILNKNNPTKYDYLQVGALSKNIENDVVNQLETKQIKHILTSPNTLLDQATIPQYILSNFLPVKHVNDYTIWERKNI